MATPIIAPVLKAAAEDIAGQARVAGQELIDHYVLNPSNVLKRFGELGQVADDMIREQRNTKDFIAGDAHANLKDIWKDITPDLRANAREVMQGKAQPVNKQVSDAVNQTRNIQAALITPLQQRGIKVIDKNTGTKVPIYVNSTEFPAIFKDNVFYDGSSAQKELAEHLVNTNQIPSIDEATQVIKKFAGGLHGRKGISLIHNMQYDVPDKFLETDPHLVFSEYANAAGQAQSMHDIFGAKNENIKAVMDGLGQQYGAYAKKYFVDLMDNVQYGFSNRRSAYYVGHTNTERMIRQFENVTKLGRMGLAEPFQSMNTLLVTNASSVYKALGDFTSNRDGAQKFAMQSAALITETIQDLKDYANGRNIEGSLFYYTGFNAARRANLILAANAGKHYANELYDKLLNNPSDTTIAEQLKSIGLDATRLMKNGLLRDDILTAGRRVAEATQFMGSPLDTPIGWHKSPLMRLVFLYKNFPYVQGKLLLNELFNSAKQGKWQNYAYMTMLFPVMGEILGDLETASRGRDPLQDRPDGFHRYLDNMSRLGGFGIMSGIVGAFNRQNLANWAMGPVLSDTFGGLQSLFDFISTGNVRKLKLSNLSKNVPVIGPAISETLKTNKEKFSERKANQKRKLADEKFQYGSQK